MRGTRSYKVQHEDSSEEDTFQDSSEEDTFQLEIKEEYDEDEEENNEDEEDNDEASLPMSELLPGPKGQSMYYDGIGYYYNETSEDEIQRLLRCSHSACDVVASMELYDGAPITILGSSNGHNHQPNPSRRERICFLHRVKTRHATESTPFSVVFQEEAKKYPVGSSFFSIQKIEQHLMKKMSQNHNNSTELTPPVSTEPSNVAKRTRGRPRSLKTPEVKRRKTEDKTFETSGYLSKKLELLKSLQVSPTKQSNHERGPKPSERLAGPHPHSFVYHDGSGHYYKALSISGSTRHLKCTTVDCDALAKMQLEENAPITLESYSPAHNHPAKPILNQKVNSDTQVTKASTPWLANTIKKETLPRRTARKRTGTWKTKQQSIEAPVEKVRTIEETLEMMEASDNEFPDTRDSDDTSDDDLPVMKHSEKLQGPEFFHDFKGNYYYSTHLTNQKRFLRCLIPTCLAEACMDLKDNAEISPVEDSRPHNHKPDTSVDYADKIKQLEGQWVEWLPSERLPSLRVQYCCYHDGKGFYFYQTTQLDNIRYLMCAEAMCPVRGHMCTQKDAPITLTPLRPPHSHPPDHTLRNALLFIDAVRVRVRSNTEPNTAIALETARNTIGAERVDLKMLQECLQQVSELANLEQDCGITENEVDFSSCVKPLQGVAVKPSTYSHEPVANHFTSVAPVSILNKKQHKTMEELLTRAEEETVSKKPQSEKVPALLSDSWLYHDCSGFYYTSKGIYQDRRYLQCVVPKCSIRASMPLENDAPIKTHLPHTHGPQPPQHRTELWFFYRIRCSVQDNMDTPFSEIYRQEADNDPEGAALIPEEEALRLMDEVVLCAVGEEDPNFHPLSYKRPPRKRGDTVNIVRKHPSEKLPSPVYGRGCQYHDGEGYYYVREKHNKKTNILYLKCICRHTCPSRATMYVEPGAPITLKALHNHEPDFLHREICLFSYSVKKRARDEFTPLQVIYSEEAKKFPEAAAMMHESKVRGKLMKIRRYVKSRLGVLAEGDDMDDEDGYSEQVKDPSYIYDDNALIFD